MDTCHGSVLTQHQTEGVSEGRLAPHQAVVEDDLGGAVDVSAADPGGRHREDADEHADVAARQHRLLLHHRINYEPGRQRRLELCRECRDKSNRNINSKI